MNWSYIASILLLIVFFGGLLFIFVMAPDRVGKTNNGFGPEWDCNSPPAGDPICIKRAMKPDKSN